MEERVQGLLILGWDFAFVHFLGPVDIHRLSVAFVAFHVGPVVFYENGFDRVSAQLLSVQQERASSFSAGVGLHPIIVWFVLVGKQPLGASFQFD